MTHMRCVYTSLEPCPRDFIAYTYFHLPVSSMPLYEFLNSGRLSNNTASIGNRTANMAQVAKERPPKVIKIILVGAANSGKIKLLYSFRDVNAIASPVGVDFIVRTYQSQSGERIKLQVWDTAGPSSSHAITSSYYRGARGILLVYDIANKDTFTALAPLFENAKDAGVSPKKIFVVGITTDTGATTRIVSEEEGREFAGKRGLSYYEVTPGIPSAAWEFLTSVTEQILEQRETGT